MAVSAAVTINVSTDSLAGRLSDAEAPLDDPENVTISTTPAPGGRGTELRVVWQAKPPTGLARAVAAVTGDDPQRQLDDAVRRFKQLVETGEILRSDASPDGTDARDQRGQRPAQPVGQTDD